jgi:hypothetical protein
MMANDLAAPVEPVRNLPAFATGLNLLQQAVHNNAAPETIRMLIELRDRMIAEERKADFDAAFAAFREKIATVPQTRKADKFVFENLADVAAMVNPLMAPLGLSWHHIETISDDTADVQCVIRHANGHSELGSRWVRKIPPLQTRGEPNVFHAGASALSFMRRWTLKGTIGIAADESDDNATAAARAAIEMITPEQAQQLFALATSLADQKALEKLLARCKAEALKDIAAADFKRALEWLAAKKQAEMQAEAQAEQARQQHADPETGEVVE